MISDKNGSRRVSLGKNESQVIMDLVRSNHAMSNNLMGICTVGLTFLLGLNFQSGQLNNLIFQFVLSLIVIGIASFGLSGFYYSIYESNFVSEDWNSVADIKKADISMIIGLMILWINPPLITLALGFHWVALLGFAVAGFGIMIFFYEYMKHKIRFIVTNVYLYYLGNSRTQSLESLP